MNNINTRRRSSFSHRSYYYYFVLFFCWWCCSCCFEAISSSKFDIVHGDSDDDDGSSRTSASSRRHRSLYDPDDKKDVKTEEKNNAVSLEHRRADIYERIFEHEEKQQLLNRESMMKRAKNTNNTEYEEEKEEKEDDDLIGIEDVRREEEEKEARGGGGAFETKTLMTERMLVELETGYAEAMREFRERANAASLEKLNRLGGAYHNATREYFEAFEENAKKMNNATMTTTDAKEVFSSTTEKDLKRVFSRRLDEYENMWIDKLGMNEFPEEPLASNAYFPEFLPTADAETLCKKFISSAKEVSPHRAKRNVIQFPDVDFFNRHTWPTLGKLIEGSAVIAESKVRSLYNKSKSEEVDDDPFTFEMVPAQIPVDQFKFSKISDCPNRENVYSCLFGKRSENEEGNNELCTKWTISRSISSKKDDDGGKNGSIEEEDDINHSYFSRQAGKNPNAHAVLTGAIINYMAPQIYVDEKFSRVKCTRTNDIESGRKSGEVFFVSVHGRRSDSCNLYSSIKKYGTDIWNDPDDRNLGRACFDSLEYKKALRMLIHKYYDQGGRGTFKSVTVLLASDSSEFIQDMVREETGGNTNELDDSDDEMNYCWIDPSTPRARDAYGTEKTYRKNVNWIENRIDLDDKRKGEVVSDLSLAELDHISKGYALIGGFHGHFTRAAYYLISGRLGAPAPYVSMDGGGFIHRDDYLQMKEKKKDTASAEKDFGESWSKWMHVV